MMRGRLMAIGMWVQRHILATVLLFGLALRLIGLETRSLQYDDTFSIFLASRSLPEILKGTAADTMPPLYYFLLHYWMILGHTAWFIRLLSVILGLAAIILLFKLVECWFDRFVAGWAAFLAAISPLMIYHSQDVRMYALLVTCQLGYLWFFTRIWLEDKEGKLRWGSWAGLVLCGAAAMYSHNVAIFLLAVPDLFLMVRGKWKLLSRLIGAQVIIGLLALPWLLVLPGQIAKVKKAWTLPRPGAIEIVQAMIMFVASLPLPTFLMVLTLFLSLLILVILALELWRGRHRQPGRDFWLTLLLLPPGLILTASFLVQPMFVPRTFVVSSLAYDVLAGLVITSTWSRGMGKVLAGLFVLAALISLPSHYTYNAFPRSPYLQVAQYLESTVLPGDRLVHETKLSYFPSHFYAPDLPQVFLADPQGSANDTFEPGSQQAMQIFPEPDLAQAVGDSRSVYFITFSQTFREYEAMGMSEHPNIRWLENHFGRTGKVVFSDLEVYHYER
jgi:mannosyltransferase